MRPLKIGVLGGIGPEATGIFYLKLIRRLQDEGFIARNEDYPQIIINSIPAPELIFDASESQDLAVYVHGLQELDSLNLDIIVMVCNTIHLYHNELQSVITARLIDLREEVKEEIARRGFKTISIIGTPSTIARGLYAFNGVRYFNPTEEEMRTLSDAIFSFNNGIDKEMQKARVGIIARSCLSRGSELVVLGCTEFTVMLDDEDIPRLNTIDVLVDCVVEEYRRHQVRGDAAAGHQNIDK